MGDRIKRFCAPESSLVVHWPFRPAFGLVSRQLLYVTVQKLLSLKQYICITSTFDKFYSYKMEKNK